MSTPTTTDAFRLLGVPPDADAATIRAAWRTLVRRYHPDHIRDDKAAANRRLAELNAAYDLVSSWQPGMGQPTTDAPTPRQRPQPQPGRARHPNPAQARRTAQAQRRAEDAAARQRAQALDRAEAARRAASTARKAAAHAASSPDQRAAATARARFLAALKTLNNRTSRRFLGFA